MIMHTHTHTHVQTFMTISGGMRSACASSLVRAFASINSVNDHRGAVSR